jgi:hypothetical protein
LLTLKNGSDDNTRLSSEAIREAVFEITQTGESVIRGEADFIDLNGIDLWLGGVHLNEKTNLWRWNDERWTIVSG